MNVFVTCIYACTVHVIVHYLMLSLTSDCIVDPLGISDASVCDAGQMAAVIPNGMFSCDGLTPDSTATFTCDDRSSVVLECQLNGAWNDTAPTCGNCKLHIAS